MITALEASVRSSKHRNLQLKTIERHVNFCIEAGFYERSIKYESIGGSLNTEVKCYLQELGYVIREEADYINISW